MAHSLSEIAEHIQAEVRESDGKLEITTIRPLHLAKQNELSFILSAKYLNLLNQTKAGAVIVPKALEASGYPGAILIVDNPHVAIAKAAQLFDNQPNFEMGFIHPTAVIGKGVKIAESVHIGPYVVIGDDVEIADEAIIEANCHIADCCQIGEKTHLKQNVTLYHQVKLGQLCLIHSGAVIGSDGFGNANDRGRWLKVPQLGGVTIGDDVEIGANTTIDRGAFSDTVIGNGVRIDNLVQIAHNVVIGDHTAIAACTGIAGSAEIGQHCMIGGGAGINGHIKITDQVVIAGMTAVANSINEPGAYSAFVPAKKIALWRRNAGRLAQLDKLAKQLHQVRAILKKQGLV